MNLIKADSLTQPDLSSASLHNPKETFAFFY